MSQPNSTYWPQFMYVCLCFNLFLNSKIRIFEKNKFTQSGATTILYNDPHPIIIRYYYYIVRLWYVNLDHRHPEVDLVPPIQILPWNVPAKERTNLEFHNKNYTSLLGILCLFILDKARRDTFYCYILSSRHILSFDMYFWCY